MANPSPGMDSADPPAGFQPLNWGRGFSALIGPLYESVAGEPMRLAFRVEPHHINGMSHCHGGMLMSFADIAWGRVISIERSSYWVTVRLTTDVISSANLGEVIDGASEWCHADDLFTVQGRIWTGNRTLMTGTGLFKAVAGRSPRPGEKAFVT